MTKYFYWVILGLFLLPFGFPNQQHSFTTNKCEKDPSIIGC